jgi:hypothetical protein
MLWPLFILLLLVWLVAVVASYTSGGLIHFLLLLAVITLVLQITRGRRTAA